MHGFSDFKYPLIILILLLINISLVTWSCGDQNFRLHDSTLPTENPRNMTHCNSSIPILPSAIHQNNVTAGTGMLGLFEITISTDPLNAFAESVLTGDNLTQPFTGNITEFLRMNPCSECLRISDVEITSRHTLRINLEIKHPVPLPIGYPPLPSERLDLHLFDLAGIIIVPENHYGSTSFPELSSHVSFLELKTLVINNSSLLMVNDWDGFTSDYNLEISRFTNSKATLHPYKILSLDPDYGNVNPFSPNGFSDIRNPFGHNVFPQNSTIHNSFEINIPSENSMKFFLALTAAYGDPLVNSNFQHTLKANPRYFIPESNRKDAWRVKINIPDQTDNLYAFDTSSSTIVELHVWDWQHSYGYPTADIDTFSSRLDALRIPSSVTACIVDIPDVNSLNFVTEPISGNGIGDKPLIYSVVVSNSKAAPAGDYTGIVGVIDQLHGVVFEILSLQSDRITTYNLPDFVTYAPFRVTIKDNPKDIPIP